MSTASADERIRWLNKRIAEGSYPNAVRVSERFGISRRQATRDVEYMRDFLNAPIKYDAKRKGFYYSEPFSLPEAISVADSDDYVELIAAMSGMADERGGFASIDEATQMSIPYTALLEIPDKLTAMKLNRMITGKVGARRGQGADNRYYCEFGSVEAFLGVLMAIGAPIKIISPEWLRSKLTQNAAGLLEANKL